MAAEKKTLKRGRPPVKEVAKARSIKLTDADWAAFRAIGGTKWLRTYLHAVSTDSSSFS